MAKYLVILESPGKIKKVKSFLGKDFEIFSSLGHIRDLPSNGLNVDIKNNFKPNYGTIPGKKEIIDNIKKKAKKSDITYIMTDEDREGSGIAWHIASILPKTTSYKRAITNSITKDAVKKAINNAGEINMDVVHSYECRRILDRICGYRTSFLITQATGGKSAGRVQSAALRILAEREKEIQNFISQEYWSINIILEKSNGERINATIKKPNKLKITSQEMANKICQVLKEKNIKVSKYETKQIEIRAYSPFTTSTMYQSSAAILGWPADKTASIAQELYEDGLISYHRTDSIFIIPEFIQNIRSDIPIRYGMEYLPSKSNVFINKKTAQEAHEAIRITDLNHTVIPTTDRNKLYEIIWKRTIASQMEKMKQHKGTAEFECEKYIFAANGSKIIFDGWYKAWNYGSFTSVELPQLEVGELMKLINIKAEKKLTQPPSRYTDQSIIKELEKKGIGRPSTYANIIKLLLQRKYIEKIKKVIYATNMGIKVSDFLIEANFCFINLDFTADMETKLDEIANKKENKLNVLNHFWDRLKSDIENAKKLKQEKSKTNYKCPKCNGILLLKYSKYGAFLSCENYRKKDEKCDYKADIDKETGKPIEKEIKKKEYSKDYICPNCEKDLLIRESKKGWKYLSCANWAKDDNCKGFYNIETGEEIIFKKK